MINKESTVLAQRWLNNLSSWQRKLVETSLQLLEMCETQEVEFSDYSFIVFPMAKAYEGFLKSFFLKMGFITKEVYEGKYFRIGRALNPDVNPANRDQDWIFEIVAQSCSTVKARLFWEAWLDCRNRIFHYFPRDEGLLSLAGAESKISQLIEAIETAIECLESE